MIRLVLILLLLASAVWATGSGSVRTTCCGSGARPLEVPCFDTATPTPTGSTPTPTVTPTQTPTVTPGGPTLTPTETPATCLFHTACDNSALASVNDSSNGSGYVWVNPQLGRITDGANAGGTNVAAGTISSYLKITNFAGDTRAGLTGCNITTGVQVIPDDAVILGFTLLIRGCEVGSANPPEIRDEVVKLVVGGTIGGTNHALSGGWDATFNCIHGSPDRTYGGPNDLWGYLGLTGTDLKASDFGVALSVRAFGGDVAPSVDGVAFTQICYKLAGE